ncbi:6-bladed beta-propeller [Gemmatimonadota bacterium]
MRSATSRCCQSLLAPALLLACACGSGARDHGEHYFRTTVEDGVPVAITSEVPKYDVPLFRYQEAVRLVQDESKPESILYSASSFRRGDDGRYYVPDRGENRIAVFREDGSYSHSIGRAGDGPGEFRSLQLLWVQGGRLAVYDIRHMRTSLFTCEGEFLRPYPAWRSGTGWAHVYPLDDGRIVTEEYGTEQKPDPARERWYAVTVISAEGDTLAALETPRTLLRQVEVVEFGFVPVPREFEADHDLVYLHERGILKYFTGEPELQRIDLQGRTVQYVRLDWERRRVTEADRIRILNGWQNDIEDEESTLLRTVYQAILENTEFADYMPFFQSASVDDFGWYWLRRQPSYEEDEPFGEQESEYMILSPEGEYLGNTTYPSPLSRCVVSQGQCLGTIEDEETGETDFVAYRIISAVPGLVYPE